MKYIRRLLLILSFLLVFVPVYPADTAKTNEYVGKLLENYTEWESASINGKLRMDRFPVNPSLKIYMERGVCVRISVRVPFMGEIARIEVGNDELLAVNKMKKTYCSGSISHIFADMPLTVSDLQDMILARIFLVGHGTLSKENFALADYTDNNDGYWYVTPFQQPASIGVEYGYVTDENGSVDILYAARKNVNATLEYEYNSKKTKLDFNIYSGSKSVDFELELEKPDWNPSPMQPFELGEKYKRLEFREFLKSL